MQNESIARALLRPALLRLAGLHDLPELDARHAISNGGALVVEASVAPRGQLSAFVESLDVCAHLSEATDGLWMLRLQFAYEHVAGGSNGYSVNFVVVTEDRFGSPHFKSLVEQSAHRDVLVAGMLIGGSPKLSPQDTPA